MAQVRAQTTAVTNTMLRAIAEKGERWPMPGVSRSPLSAMAAIRKISIPE